jgi:hypothetical protein
VYEDAPSEVTEYRDLQALCDVLLSMRSARYTWYAHDGGEHAYKYLLTALTTRLDSEPALEALVIAQGHDRVIGFIIRRGHRVWELRDSAALLPVSLEQLCADFAPRYSTRIPDVCRLLTALQAAYHLIESTFAVRPGWTVGATALRAWRATLADKQYFIRQRPTVERFAREAYYGGMTFLGSTWKHLDCVTLDVNSMYPFVMREYGVPCGVACYTESWHPELPGFYAVRANVPATVLRSAVPHRTEHGVTFPHGTFDTILTSTELEYARLQGTSFGIRYGYTFERIAYPFARFVNACEGIRTSRPGTAQDRLAKLLQANLYGKFGTRPFVERYALFGSPPDEAEWFPMINEHTGAILPHLYSRTEPINQPYIHPEWAAWITAQARVTLLHTVYSVGAREVLYGDTDSFTASRVAIADAIERGVVSIGTAYGQWKIEREYSWFHAGSAKNYQGQLTDGRLFDKAAGIMRPLIRHVEHARSLNGETVTTHGVSTPHTGRVLRGASIAPEGLTRSYARVEREAD